MRNKVDLFHVSRAVCNCSAVCCFARVHLNHKDIQTHVYQPKQRNPIHTGQTALTQYIYSRICDTQYAACTLHTRQPTNSTACVFMCIRIAYTGLSSTFVRNSSLLLCDSCYSMHGRVDVFNNFYATASQLNAVSSTMHS